MENDEDLGQRFLGQIILEEFKFFYKPNASSYLIYK